MNQLKVVISSAGIKGAPLVPHDYHIDCRSIANPFHIPALDGKTGDDPEVQDWVKSHTKVDTYIALLNEAISRIPTRRKGVGKDPFEKPFTVLCFCAHGVHRSRSMKHILAAYLKGVGVEVSVE